MYKKFIFFILVCGMIVSPSLAFGQSQGEVSTQRVADGQVVKPFSISPRSIETDPPSKIGLPACVNPDVDLHYKIAVEYIKDIAIKDDAKGLYKVVRSSAREVGHCNNMSYLSTAFNVELADANSYGEVTIIPVIGIVTVDGETQKPSFTRIGTIPRPTERPTPTERPIPTDKPTPTGEPPVIIPACQHPDQDRHYSLAEQYMKKQGDEYVVDRTSNRLVGRCMGGTMLSTEFDVYQQSPIAITSDSVEISETKDPVFVGIVSVDGETESVSFNRLRKMDRDRNNTDVSEGKAFRVQYPSSEGSEELKAEKISDLVVEPTLDKKKTLIKETFSSHEEGGEDNAVSVSVVETDEAVEVTDQGMFVRGKEIKVLPNQALSAMQRRMDVSKDVVELKEVNNRFVYEVVSERKAKILGLFPTTVVRKASVDAENASTEFESPWWSFLAF